MTPQAAFTAARNAGTPVTLHFGDGRVLTGVPIRLVTPGFASVRYPDGKLSPAFMPEQIVEVRPA
ncbi:RNA binding protein [Arthrobacter phage Snek]|uniref:RNA binding protein n=1 Tax=Arthrobacter phage Tweety19 TaxID=2768133 RepID=A0A7G9W252_9CAUD|nr:hypothetical protein PQE19_gp53 [Arthrobacter phage Tweety19]QNO12715.1 RNA binding protein [Arthrobacter phage Tweety19]